jgi:hypothetical protein
MMGIGVAIAEQSVAGTTVCLIAVVIIMGMGFKRKRKLRQNGEL